MVGKSCVLALIVVLELGKPQMLVAQVPLQINQVYGTFGSRTFGQPLTPGPNTFGGGSSTGAGGSILSLRQGGGYTPFANSWRQSDTGALAQAVGAASAAQASLNAAVAPQSPASNNNFPVLPTSPEFAPQSFAGANLEEGLSALAQGIGLNANIAPAVAFTAAVPGAGTNAPASAARPQPYTRSAELSALLTRIARSKGILSSQGIDVYMSNNVARLQGTVRSPADCVLLANVLALEPEVRQIDNRLVAEGAGAPSPN